MQFPFVGPSFIARSRNISFDECINYYPEISEQQTAKNVRSLIGTPGTELWVTPTTSAEGRGTYQPAGTYNNTVWAVVGNTLYKYDAIAGTETSIGTIGTSTGQLHFADSGSSQTNKHLLFVDGVNAYYVDMATNTLTQLTNATHGIASGITPNWCTFLDGYFIINDTGSLTCYRSNQWDASTWVSTNQFTVESTPDNCNAVIVHDGNTWAFGQSSHEVFYNSGGSQLFLRVPGSPSDVGLIAPHSLAYNGSSLFWVGANRYGTSAIYMSEGFDGRPISTFSIENDLEGYNITDAVGSCYSQEGHNFYMIAFPTGNKTWVYDISTGYWHRRTYLNNGSEDMHRAIRTINVNAPNTQGFVLMQDWESGLLYKAKLDVYTDNGAEIRRVRSCPTIHKDREKLSFGSFQVDMETGVGLTSGQGSDPKGVIQISNDSGHTFGNQIDVSLGKIGKYTHRVKINRLGQSYDRVFRFICSEPIKQVIVGGYAEASLDGS